MNAGYRLTDAPGRSAAAACQRATADVYIPDDVTVMLVLACGLVASFGLRWRSRHRTASDNLSLYSYIAFLPRDRRELRKHLNRERNTMLDTWT
jgi:hypothetical protein